MVCAAHVVRRAESAGASMGRRRMENHKPRCGADSQSIAAPATAGCLLLGKNNKPGSFSLLRHLPCEIVCRSGFFHDHNFSTNVRVDQRRAQRVRRAASHAATCVSSSDKSIAARRMTQRSHRNEIHASRRDLPHIFQRNSAARFEFYFIFSERHRFAHFRRLHVVEQDDVNSIDLKKRADLFEMVGLHFDPQIGTFASHARNGLRETGQAALRADVIVFDQNHVVKAEAMIRAAAGEDGLFFQSAQSRRRLARIENLRPMFSDCFDKLPCQCRDSAKPLQKIESNPLRCQDGSERNRALQEWFRRRSATCHQVAEYPLANRD